MLLQIKKCANVECADATLRFLPFQFGLPSTRPSVGRFGRTGKGKLKPRVTADFAKFTDVKGFGEDFPLFIRTAEASGRFPPAIVSEGDDALDAMVERRIFACNALRNAE